ncbi:hypothetical protein YC2023_082728 [Brassica napus]
MHAWSACKKPHQYTHVDQHASVACAETPRAWSTHLVLLHVRLHVQLPCTVTPRASGDTHLVRCLTPRSEPMQQATSSFSVASGFLEEFHNTEIRVFAQFRVFPSCFDPVVLRSRHFPRKLRDEETSVFKNVELLNRRASKIVMLPKLPSDQSKTSSNNGRAAYLNSCFTHDPFFDLLVLQISRSICIARDSTTKLMLDQSSGVQRRRLEFRKELSFLFSSLPTLETAQPEVGSSGWKSTARRVVSGAFPVALENSEDRVPLTPGRTNNRIRSPR